MPRIYELYESDGGAPIAIADCGCILCVNARRDAANRAANDAIAAMWTTHVTIEPGTLQTEYRNTMYEMPLCNTIELPTLKDIEEIRIKDILNKMDTTSKLKKGKRMNKYIEVKIKEYPEEYKTLYELTYRRKIDPMLRDAVRKRVREIRQDMRLRYDADKLATKAELYGAPGSWALFQIQELSKDIYRNKKPEAGDVGKWLSVEIECIFKNKDAETKFVCAIRAAKLNKYVTVKDDGSVSPNKRDNQGYSCECSEETLENDGCQCESSNQVDDSEYGREIIVTFKYGDWDVLKQVCNKLNELKCYVNKSCGLHVHFDCRHLGSSRKLATVAKRVARAVPVLRLILPKSRLDNQYCRNVINTLNSGERYCFVNVQSYKKHQTLEIRGHSGTTDAVKIINWIRIIQTIMNKRCTYNFTMITDFTKFDFDADLVQYIESRYNKFNSVMARKPVDDIAEDNETVEVPLAA